MSTLVSNDPKSGTKEPCPEAINCPQSNFETSVQKRIGQVQCINERVGKDCGLVETPDHKAIPDARCKVEKNKTRSKLYQLTRKAKTLV